MQARGIHHHSEFLKIMRVAKLMQREGLLDRRRLSHHVDRAIDGFLGELQRKRGFCCDLLGKLHHEGGKLVTRHNVIDHAEPVRFFRAPDVSSEQQFLGLARPELSSFVMALAEKIAAKPSFALKLTKEAVNRSVDVMGQPAAIEQAFALHQLCHAHNLQEFGMVVDPAGLHPSVRKTAVVK